MSNILNIDYSFLDPRKRSVLESLQDKERYLSNYVENKLPHSEILKGVVDLVTSFEIASAEFTKSKDDMNLLNLLLSASFVLNKYEKNNLPSAFYEKLLRFINKTFIEKFSKYYSDILYQLKIYEFFRYLSEKDSYFNDLLTQRRIGYYDNRNRTNNVKYSFYFKESELDKFFIDNKHIILKELIRNDYGYGSSFINPLQDDMKNKIFTINHHIFELNKKFTLF